MEPSPPPPVSASLLLNVLQARRVGMAFAREGALLVLDGPRNAEPLARALLARKVEVFTLLDLLTGAAPALDWRSTGWARPAPCRACALPSRQRDPYDGHPWHQRCAETALAQAGKETCS